MQVKGLVSDMKISRKCGRPKPGDLGLPARRDQLRVILIGVGAKTEMLTFRQLASITEGDITESDGSLKHEFKIVCF
jgi:hypothetical protein